MATRLLMSADESTGPLAAVRGLRQAGFAPYVAVSQRITYAARSRAAAGVVPVADAHGDPDGHARDLAAAARELGVAAVLPGTEASLFAVSGREERFAGIPVGTPSGAALRQATDKANLQALAEAHGLRTPPARVLDARSATADIPLPAVVKPVRTVDEEQDGGLSTERALVARSHEELRAFVGRPSREGWLVQPFRRGELMAVSGVAWQGRTLSALHQRSPLTWPPDTGTSALAVTVAPDRDLERRVAGLLEAIGWSGVYNLQFLADREGPWLIDFNPRVYGSIALAIAAGHNLPALWARALLGERPAVAPYTVGVGLRIEGRFVRALGARLREEGPGALRALPDLRRAHLAVASLRDPAPLITAGAKWWLKVRPGSGPANP